MCFSCQLRCLCRRCRAKRDKPVCARQMQQQHARRHHYLAEQAEQQQQQQHLHLHRQQTPLPLPLHTPTLATRALPLSGTAVQAAQPTQTTAAHSHCQSLLSPSLVGRHPRTSPAHLSAEQTAHSEAGGQHWPAMARSDKPSLCPSPSLSSSRALSHSLSAPLLPHDSGVAQPSWQQQQQQQQQQPQYSDEPPQLDLAVGIMLLKQAMSLLVKLPHTHTQASAMWQQAMASTREMDMDTAAGSDAHTNSAMDMSSATTWSSVTGTDMATDVHHTRAFHPPSPSATSLPRGAQQLYQPFQPAAAVAAMAATAASSRVAAGAGSTCRSTD